jgi:anti-sigma factor RsiW
MNCENVQNMLDSYQDGELDLTNHLEIERHLKDCDVCGREYQNRRVLKSSFDESFYFRAPANLRKNIVSALRETKSEPAPNRFWQWRWLAIATSAAAAVVLITFILFHVGPANNETLAAEMVSNHVRSMMVNHLTDVLSTDQHTVKPWFEGKLDFSPPVVDLTSQGFTLTGGRLDYATGRPIAALVYQRRQHYINLFIYPSARNTSPETKTLQGFNVIHWEKSGMAFWAVSDLNANELAEFTEDLQK